MITVVRAITRVILVFLIVFPIGWIQSCLQWLLPRPAFYVFPQWLCQGVLWALDIRLDVRGKKCTERPVLYVANHASYLDIIVLQAVIKASFISKAEVARWPLFGWLAKLQKSIFIQRVRSQAAEHTDLVAARVKAGGDLILFPEGTTGDGSRILPVKSSLLGVAPLAKAVQPVTVAFTALDGIPPGRTFRYMYAWVGDEDLQDHILRILTMGDMTLVVTFHEPIRDGLDNRKKLAARIETVMRAGLNANLTGRAA
jgi:1-acyl-sn-glycerol-3-phosphate acyltransferase